MLAVGSQVKNNMNFGSKIILAKNAYDALPLEAMKKNRQYIFSWTPDRFITTEQGYTDGALTCVMGWLKPKGEAEGLLIHSSSMNPWEKVKKEVLDAVEKFQKKSPQKKIELEGMLFGAQAEKTKSMAQCNNFLQLFDDLKVEYSAFLAQKNSSYLNPGMDMAVSGVKDECALKFLGCGQVKNLEDLSKHFEIVKKHPKDEIIFE